MADREHFWRLEHLSDRQLLERLQGVLCTQRCALADLIAHLGEVEERRLHLTAACGSLFSYCVQRLGMSEDEACRRIDLARLARNFPLLFGELASGRISLSVALLLKPVLTPDNHAEPIAAARGASLRTARELLAVRFPSPDVPSRIRKLPERRVAHAIPAPVADVAHAIPAASANVAHAVPAPVADVAHAIPAASANVAHAVPAPVADVAHAIPAASANVAHAVPAAVAAVVPAPVTTPDTIGATTARALTSSPQPHRSPELELGAFAGVHASLLQDPLTSAEPSHASSQAGLPRCAEPRQRIDPHQRIDPLSAERYRIQFTADGGLKQKLELARDLLRHSHPSGDLGPIVSRALDLLLQDLLQRRFGARRKDTPYRSARTASHAAPTAPPTTPPSEALRSATLPLATAALARPVPAPSVASPLATAAPARPVLPPSVASPLPAAPLAASRPLATTLPLATAVLARPLAAPSAAAPVVTASTMSLAATAPGAGPASRIARAARRAVLERDGLGCCWVDAAGNRCGSTAWLELDHYHPSGRGGSSEPENLRLLCRAHNRFAAERAYGREHVERAIQARRSAKRRDQSGPPPSASPAPA